MIEQLVEHKILRVSSEMDCYSCGKYPLDGEETEGVLFRRADFGALFLCLDCLQKAILVTILDHT